jgi:hypothetical protein
MPDDIEQRIDKTVDDFIGEVAPGTEPQNTTPPSPDRTPAPGAGPITSLAKPAAGTAGAIPYPKSWKQDYAPLWSKIPPEVQKYVSEVREKDYLDGLEQYKRGHTAYSEIHEVMQPYMPRLTALNLQPAEAIRALMNADWALSQGTPEQKAAMVAQICQNYGIDPRTIQIASADPNAPQPSPGEIELRKRFDGLHSNLNQFIQSQIAEKRAVIDKDVATFAADPKHPYFDEVADDIVRLINADKAISLGDAYEKAVWANPTTRAKEIERLNKERSETERKAREEAARRARGASAANIRGKPTDKATGAAGKSWEEDLEDKAAEIRSRTS